MAFKLIESAQARWRAVNVTPPRRPGPRRRPVRQGEIRSSVLPVRYPGENAQRPTYEPLGLASDELFAIPARPPGAGLDQSSMAPE